jgi:TrmH family RNA methyltransferase
MITSKDNQQLKTIRKLLQKRRDGLFVAEGEDLVDAAATHGWEPEILLRAGEDVDPDLLPSSLGSGTRVVGVYRERWADAQSGDVRVYLDGVRDPGNIGTVIRSLHALADGPLVLGPGCADPYGPKAVRASMGSIFARPPARASFDELHGTTVGLERGRGVALSELWAEPPLTVCLGSERHGLSDVEPTAWAHIPINADGPDSLNVAMAATVALYERNRIPRHAA